MKDVVVQHKVTMQQALVFIKTEPYRKQMQKDKDWLAPYASVFHSNFQILITADSFIKNQLVKAKRGADGKVDTEMRECHSGHNVFLPGGHQIHPLVCKHMNASISP